MQTGTAHPYMTHSVVRRKIAEVVRAERARLQWTQYELAARANVSVVRVIDLENEKRDPRFSTVERITEALGLRLCVEQAA